MLATRRCQTGAKDLQEINLPCKNTTETESFVLKVLSQRLKQKQEELDDLKKEISVKIWIILKTSIQKIKDKVALWSHEIRMRRIGKSRL
jgi:hypothetical protein